MNVGLNILSEITVFSKYARYIPKLKRRETWDEIVDRYETMLVKKYPKQKEAIAYSLPFIREKKILPSMRALQFAGPAAEVNNARIYNCCYLPIDSIYSFSETMFLLLGGTGVGYSVQEHHVAELPVITKPKRNRKFLIEDSIMGWADSIKVLMKAYLGGGPNPNFDFRAIREKGARLVTAGGKAPGPEPLKICLFQIKTILERKENGERLTTLECHDILCHIANSVLAGGIRRSAMIALFSHDDEDMLTCKFGNWYELNEQRGRANNSIVLEREKIEEKEFKNIWERIKVSGSGEPGIYWTNDKNYGTNPCVEIALRPYQFCNLVEVNVSNIKDQDDLNARVAAAAYFGTLQAGFTDFHYLRPVWEETTRKDALIGVSMTGIGSGVILDYNLTQAAHIAKVTNSIISEMININEAARVTCVKPAGTTSLVLKTSSGIHAWHSPYYDRIIRFGKTEPQAIYLMEHHPEICEDDVLRPKDTLCIRIPIKAPKGSIFRTESALDLLERVKKFSKEWILPGHVSGVNTHNVSATITIDNEWDEVGEWMWDNKEVYNGLSILPKDGGTYVQTPFTNITEEEYNERIKLLKDVDLTQIVEFDDHIDFSQTVACAGSQCEVNL